MKIRNKTMLMLMTVAIMLTVLLTLSHLVFEIVQQRTYEKNTQKELLKFNNWDNRRALSLLSPFCKEYLNHKTFKLAEKLATFINNNTTFGINNKVYKAKIRKILQNEIFLEGIEVGFSYILNSNGKVVVSSTSSDEGLDGIAFINKYPGMNKIYSELSDKNNASGYYNYMIANKGTDINKEYMVIRSIPGSKYFVMFTLSLSKYFKPMRKILEAERNREVGKLLKHSESQFKSKIIVIILFSIVSFLLIYFLSVLLAWFFSNSISKPIMKLKGEVKKIGRGNFNISLKETGFNEIKDLLNSFNFLGQELKEYMDDLEKEVSSREKIETELKIACDVQMSYLPRVDYDFDNEDISIAAQLIPANVVAGDFYDFFYTDNGKKLVLLVGDVSGKSIYAAIFMAMTKTLLHSLCLQSSDPAAILAKANEALSRNNEKCMFATLFLVIYDIKSKKIKFSNAGHEPLIHFKNDSDFNFIGNHEKPALGLIAGSKYKTESMKVADNDTLILYTDGVTDARALNRESYGEKQFVNSLKDNIKLSADDLCRIVIKKVEDFEHGKLFDDITLLIFKRLR